MNDQASRLRQIVKDLREQNQEPKKNTTRIITITSGKGGVGKSNFTVNLGLSLRALGHRVLILDADFGLANIDVILGVHCKYNLSHVLHHGKSLVDVISEGPLGLRLISGGSGISELINLKPEHLEAAMSEFYLLNDMVDFILIDTGAGVSELVTKLIAVSKEVILITTPEPTAIMDAYALLKMAKPIQYNQELKIWLVVNKAESAKEADDILSNFTTVSERFLKAKVDMLGFIGYDGLVTKSVKQQIPFVLSYPKSNASKHINGITAQLLNNPLAASADNEFVQFFKRFAGLMRKG